MVPSDLELYKEHFEPGCLLVNGYGLSESTVSLQCFFDMAYENAGGSIPIGTPVEETRSCCSTLREIPGRSVGRSPWPAPIWPRLLAASGADCRRLSG